MMLARDSDVMNKRSWVAAALVGTCVGAAVASWSSMYIPISWVPWAELSDSDVVGSDQLILPDGTAALVGPGANGHIWMHIVQVNSG